MRRNFRFSVTGSCVLSILLFSVWAFSADEPNFSGRYALARNTSATDSVLEVVQDTESVEITRTYDGKRFTNRYPLGGGEADCRSPSQVPSKCKGQLHRNQLILDTVAMTRPQAQGPAMRVRVKERWQLSSDSKNLTIQTDVDFPDAREDISAVAGGTISGKEKYVRVVEKQ